MTRSAQAHSSTSISAGLGMAVARDLAGGSNRVVAVIGDGRHERRHGLRGHEQCGCAAQPADRGAERQRHVDRPAGRRYVGAPVTTLSGRPYVTLRNLGRTVAEALPKPLELAAKRAEEFARGLVAGGTLFEELASTTSARSMGTISTTCCRC